jgi:hypothetical protein
VFVGAGVTAGALGLGIGFAIDSSTAHDSSLDALSAARARFGAGSACAAEPGAGSAECEELASLRDRRTRSGNVANASFIIAGAAAVFSIGAYFLWPKRTAHATARLIPVVGHRHGSLLVTGSF